MGFQAGIGPRANRASPSSALEEPARLMNHSLDHDGLARALEDSGWRCTPQRLAVYDYLTRAEHHPTAEDVYRAVKTAIPKVSLATVYKALDALVASNLASKLTAGDGSARYGAPRSSLPCTTAFDLVLFTISPTPFDPQLIDKLDPHLMQTLEGQRVPGDWVPA